jgi:hypothetical protein
MKATVMATRPAAVTGPVEHKSHLVGAALAAGVAAAAVNAAVAAAALRGGVSFELSGQLR